MNRTQLSQPSNKLGKSNLMTYISLFLAIVLAFWISVTYPRVSSSKKSPISVADFMFDLAATSKQFENDGSFVCKYYAADHWTTKEASRMASKAFVEEISEQKNAYPLTRLVVAKSFFGEKIHEFKRHSKSAAAGDAILAQKVRDELENAAKPNSQIKPEAIEIALPNDMMRLYFASKDKHRGGAERAHAREVLNEKIDALHAVQVGLSAFDFVLGGIAIALFIYLVITKFRMFRPISEELVEYPQALNFFAIVFAVIVANIGDGLVYIIARLILQNFVTTSMADNISQAISYPFSVLILYEIGVRQLNLPMMEGFRFRWSDINSNLRMLFVGFAAYLLLVLTSIAMTITSIYLPSEIADESILIRVFDAINESSFIALILRVDFLGPITEELAFRGFMFSAFRAKWGFSISAVLSAALFAAAHFHINPYTALHHFLFGLLAAYLLEKTRSVIPAIVMHCFWNASVTISVLLHLLIVYPASKIFF